MTYETFSKGIAFAEEYGEGAFLGGGEPTDHPLFMRFICDVLASNVELEASGTITNGTNEKIALFLSRLKGVIYAELSLTPYHDSSMVSEQVKRAYKDRTRVSANVCNQGRGHYIPGAVDRCVCPELFLDHNGDLYPCGCRKKKYGNIHTGFVIPDDRQGGECYKDQ